MSLSGSGFTGLRPAPMLSQGGFGGGGGDYGYGGPATSSPPSSMGLHGAPPLQQDPTGYSQDRNSSSFSPYAGGGRLPTSYSRTAYDGSPQQMSSGGSPQQMGYSGSPQQMGSGGSPQQMGYTPLQSSPQRPSPQQQGMPIPNPVHRPSVSSNQVSSEDQDQEVVHQSRSEVWWFTLTTMIVAVLIFIIVLAWSLFGKRIMTKMVEGTKKVRRLFGGSK